MLTKTKLIVLSQTKYKDSDLIVRCYTKQRGIVSYIIRSAFKSKKGTSKKVYFQPLSQLLIEESYKPNRSLQTIKEVKFSYLYTTIYNDVYKSAITFFLSDVLNSTLKEEEPNEDLFHFIELSMQYLNTEDKYANFHLLFLLKLTKYLGFYPEHKNMEFPHFNMEKGVFEASKNSMYTVSGDNLTLLKLLLGTNFDALNKIKISSARRQDFLSMLLYYFELHLGDFKKPKSLQVLNEVFH